MQSFESAKPQKLPALLSAPWCAGEGGESGFTTVTQFSANAYPKCPHKPNLGLWNKEIKYGQKYGIPNFKASHTVIHLRIIKKKVNLTLQRC